MKRKGKVGLITVVVFSIVSIATSSFAAESHQQQQSARPSKAPFTVHKLGAAKSVHRTRLPRFKADVKTWGVGFVERSIPVRTISDPYALHIENVDPGTAISVNAQLQHQTLDVPRTGARQWKELSGKEKKIARRERSREIRRRFVVSFGDGNGARLDHPRASHTFDALVPLGTKAGRIRYQRASIVNEVAFEAAEQKMP